MLKYLYGSILAAALIFNAAGVMAAPQQSKYFGFYEVEFYKGSNLAQSLKHSDINGDGLADLSFLDVEKSQIAILLNAPGNGVSGETGLNSIKYDDRFARFNVALERKVYDYQFIKLKGDTLESLVLLSEPRWLVLYRQNENMQFYEYSKTQLDDSNYSKAQIISRDVDGDGLADLLVMSPDFFVSVPNREASSFTGNAGYIPLASEYGGEPSQFDVFDINSDGFNDIIYSYSAKNANLRIRYGARNAWFPDEESHDLLSFRTMDFFRLSGGEDDKKAFMGCVLETSNSAYVYEISGRTAAANDKSIKLCAAYFNKDDKSSKNIFSVNDFNSDGISDLAVINPEQARLGVYFFSAENRAASYAGFPFPSQIAGAFGVRSKKADVNNFIAFSKDALLKASLNAKNFKYDFSKPVEGFGAVFFAAPYKTDKGEKIAVFSKESGEVVLKTADADLESPGPKYRIEHALDNLTAVKIIGGKDSVEGFIAFFKYDGARVFIKGQGDIFTQAAFNEKNAGGAMETGNLILSDYNLDKTYELLFCDKNIIKIYGLDLEGRRLAQIEQINIGPADFASDCIGEAGGKIFVYDPDSKRLFEYDKSSREKKISAVEKKLAGASVIDLNSRPAFLTGPAVITLIDGPRVTFSKFSVAEYEEIKNGRYNNLLAEDINGDGSADLVLTCGSQNYLDIFSFGDKSLKHSLRFKIFNTKQFNQYSSYTSEPQAIDSADFDADGFNDLAMMVHNKILIYYSDSPQKPNTADGVDKKEVK